MKTRNCVFSLIGRPNVGKSTIFNRLMKKSYKAMTHNQPGVTRDRHYGIAQVEDIRGENEKDYILVDTGGFYPEKIEETKITKKKTAEPFFNIMADQAKIAIDESDVVLMVVDVREGLIPFDKTICNYIRTTKKPVWLLVNKFDDDAQWGTEADFYELGLDEDSFFILSGAHGRGFSDLKERMFKYVNQFNEEIAQVEADSMQKGVTPDHDVVSNIALIGAPNAGKSTLLNRLIGAQRALVSNVAGTTVDPIEGYMDLYFGKKVDKLSSQDNPFRKTNVDLLDELTQIDEERSDITMMSYGTMSPDDMEDEVNSADEEVELLTGELPESDDLFTIDDLESSIETGFSASENDDQEDEDSEEAQEEVNPFRSIKIVDTAGIRKQNNVEGFIEEQSVYRSLRAISECDVVIYMIDSLKGITHQDRRLCDIALEKGKSIIICLNKADLIPEITKDAKTKREWLEDLKATIPWLSFCQLLTISAKKGQNIKGLKDALQNTIMVRNKRITTGLLNKTLNNMMDRNPIVIAGSGGQHLRVKYASMLKASPPTFLLFTNKSKSIPDNYRKYLTNGLRREFGMVNTPVHLIFRTTNDIEKRLRKSLKEDPENTYL